MSISDLKTGTRLFILSGLLLALKIVGFLGWHRLDANNERVAKAMESAVLMGDAADIARVRVVRRALQSSRSAHVVVFQQPAREFLIKSHAQS